MNKIKAIILALALIVVSIIFTFVNYSKAQTKPTRTWMENLGTCQPPAQNCFDDIIIEPPQ
ncbi:hypothetical protein [Candidatus Kryptobacter tengchongensis]|uniref:Transmembrane protein n=1 Tax=Kryptobacter tengchongensis TaxID=1643429 RepID=A0A656D9Y9_KRYT1|nr:hypothetical protein [Candidatus Kryptobacter tengchongensis]CUT05038.1 hypothetical protein JGI24_01612 [Candidatus Kryptobacter tengchongensis]